MHALHCMQTTSVAVPHRRALQAPCQSCCADQRAQAGRRRARTNRTPPCSYDCLSRLGALDGPPRCFRLHAAGRLVSQSAHDSRPAQRFQAVVSFGSCCRTAAACLMHACMHAANSVSWDAPHPLCSSPSDGACSSRQACCSNRSSCTSCMAPRPLTAAGGAPHQPPAGTMHTVTSRGSGSRRHACPASPTAASKATLR